MYLLSPSEDFVYEDKTDLLKYFCSAFKWMEKANRTMTYVKKLYDFKAREKKKTLV